MTDGDASHKQLEMVIEEDYANECMKNNDKRPKQSSIDKNENEVGSRVWEC